MCKIIQFPANRIQYTNGFKNLEALFKICDSTETCNFYLGSAEQLFTDDRITENELLTLRRIGRQKRLELAAPAPQKPQEAAKPGTYCYTPEMGQSRPDCQMEASLSFDGKHYFVETPFELKGRGISFVKKFDGKELSKSGQYKAGWNEYQVTKLAYSKLKERYTISMECYLD